MLQVPCILGGINIKFYLNCAVGIYLDHAITMYHDCAVAIYSPHANTIFLDCAKIDINNTIKRVIVQ